jgi:hypothetical protein
MKLPGIFWTAAMGMTLLCMGTAARAVTGNAGNNPFARSRGLDTLGGALLVEASDLNIDFGNADGGPSSGFGAAAGQAGSWNVIADGNQQSLVNLAGLTTSAQITVTASSFAGANSDPAHSGDLAALLDDNFYSNPNTSWSFTITGLTDGYYDIYYYAPSNAGVDTGNFTLNGNAISNIPGDDGNGFTEGVDWEVYPDLDITAGSLTAVSSSINEFQGLAGLQIVAVPESSAWRMTMLGLVGVAAVCRMRRKGGA